MANIFFFCGVEQIEKERRKTESEFIRSEGAQRWWRGLREMVKNISFDKIFIKFVVKLN